MNEICPLCGKEVKIEDFKDCESLREFKISRMCLDCQKKVLK